MSELIEVVFENVHKTEVNKLLISLIAVSETIVNIQCSEDIELINKYGFNEKSLNSVLNLDGNIWIFINFDNTSIGVLTIPNVLLRLIKYEEYYDVELNLDLEEVGKIDSSILIAELHNKAMQIAKEYNISEFFCGMEPASDENTRYFTNKNLGPLILN